MNRILVVVGHPYWTNSHANKAILEEFVRINPHAVVSNLAELYPDGKIDIEAEQQKLVEADTVVLQYPTMWFSCPSLMHKYFEEVMAYGFSYGHGGDALRGKSLVNSFTCGGSADSYTDFGGCGMTVDQLMPPFIGLAKYMGMVWKGYVCTAGMMLPTDTSEDVLASFKVLTADHARRLTAMVNS